MNPPPPSGAGARPMLPPDWLPSGFAWRLVGVLGVLLMARLATLYFARTELFFDEAQYWVWSRDLDLGYFSKPPMIAWIIGATTQLCGNGEACVRLASPLIHTATSVLVFLLGRKLFDSRFGFWSAVVFATLPGVSLSSTLISTDVPLLFFWTAALFCLVKLLETRGLWWAVLLGLSLGLGLMAKYAMVYFLLGLGVYMVLAPGARWLLRSGRLLLAALVAFVCVLPNIVWNIDNGFVTFFHTADNANLSGPSMDLVSGLEFFGAQFGVFGPILFAVLGWGTWRAAREKWGDPYRLLISFCIPIIALILVQALLSRAHANWAAVAYVTGSVMVAAIMVERSARKLYAASFLINFAAMIALSVGVVMAGRIAMPMISDPYERVLGWEASALAARDKALEVGAVAIITDQRAIAAAFSYYLRDANLPILRWSAGGRPRDHFELTSPLTRESPMPALLVTRKMTAAREVEDSFEIYEPLGSASVAVGMSGSRKVYFFKVSGFRGVSDLAAR